MIQQRASFPPRPFCGEVGSLQAIALLSRSQENAMMPPSGNVVCRPPARHGGGREAEESCDENSSATPVDDFVNCPHASLVTETVTLWQEGITNFGMDGRAYPLERGGVVDHDTLLSGLVAKLESGELKNADVARRLSIAPARVSEMRKGSRRLQQREMPIVAEMLGLTAAQPKLTPIHTTMIRLLGKVAQGVWMEETVADNADPEFVAYDMQAGDPCANDLFAVIPEGASMNLRFTPGMVLICRRIPFTSSQFKSGDYVIVQRRAHDMCELTCKRVELDEDGQYWLHCESDRPEFAEPWLIGKPNHDHHDDMEITIIAKVIRGVLNFER